MSYKRNIASNFTVKIINIIIGFIANIITARVLGPTGQGYVSYFMVIFVTIAANGDFGINQVAIHFINNPKYKKEEVYSINVTFLSIVFVAISAVIFILDKCNLIFNDYSSGLIFLGLIYIFGSFIGNLCTHFYVASENIIKLNKYQVIEKLFYLTGILALWMGKVLTVNTYIIVFVLSLLIRVILSIHNMDIKFKFQLNKCFLKDEILFGLQAYFAVLFVYLNYKADQYMIRKMIGVSELGIYSIGVMLSELLFLIPNSVATVLLGRLYNIDEGSGELKRITAVTTKYSLYIISILALAGYFLSPLVTVLYGKQYSGAVSVIKILIIGIVFASIGKIGSSYYYRREKLKVYLLITSITLLLNVIMNLIMIPVYGINGAAIASTISYTIYGIMNLCYFVWFQKFSFKEIFLISKSEANYIKNIAIKMKCERK